MQAATWCADLVRGRLTGALGKVLEAGSVGQGIDEVPAVLRARLSKSDCKTLLQLSAGEVVFLDRILLKGEARQYHDSALLLICKYRRYDRNVSRLLFSR